MERGNAKYKNLAVTQQIGNRLCLFASCLSASVQGTDEMHSQRSPEVRPTIAQSTGGRMRECIDLHGHSPTLSFCSNSDSQRFAKAHDTLT